MISGLFRSERLLTEIALEAGGLEFGIRARTPGKNPIAKRVRNAARLNRERIVISSEEGTEQMRGFVFWVLVRWIRERRKRRGGGCFLVERKEVSLSFVAVVESGDVEEV